MTLETDALIERRRLKRRLVLWRAVGVLALLGLALAGLYRIEPTGIAGGGDHVARVTVSGVILENGYLEERLEELAKNRRARALIVYVNSPGGSTYGGEALFSAIRRVSAGGKPVVAVIGTLGASAGYMVALAADRVYVRESSLTGSIGVLFQSAEFSKLMEKAGITPLSVTSGPYKDEPSPFRPLTEGGRRVLQDMVNESHRWFIGLVADRRKMPLERVARIADGRVYSGRAALDLGLVDAFGGEREARAWLAETHGVSASLPVQDVPTQPPAGVLRDALGQLVQKTFLSERLTLDGLISVWHPE